MKKVFLWWWIWWQIFVITELFTHFKSLFHHHKESTLIHLIHDDFWWARLHNYLFYYCYIVHYIMITNFIISLHLLGWTADLIHFIRNITFPFWSTGIYFLSMFFLSITSFYFLFAVIKRRNFGETLQIM